MAHTLQGTAYFAKVFPENAEDNKYSLEVGQLTPESIALLKSLKIPVKECTKEGAFNKGSFFTLWQYAKSQKGEQNPLPVIDMQGKPITELIGNGSIVNVEFRPKDWTMLHEKTRKPIGNGTRALLLALQVVSLKTFGARTIPGSSFTTTPVDLEDEVPFDMVGGE